MHWFTSTVDSVSWIGQHRVHFGTSIYCYIQCKKVHFYYRKYALVSDLYIEWVNANPAIVMEEKEWK